MSGISGHGAFSIIMGWALLQTELHSEAFLHLGLL